MAAGLTQFNSLGNFKEPSDVWRRTWGKSANLNLSVRNIVLLSHLVRLPTAMTREKNTVTRRIHSAVEA